MKCTLETPKYHISFFKFVRHFIYNKKNKKIVPFYYLTGEYLMIYESESSCILNNMGFSADWNTESVTAEIITT